MLRRFRIKNGKDYKELSPSNVQFDVEKERVSVVG